MKNLPQAVLEINGIGYGVSVSLECLDKMSLGQEALLYTHHHIGEDKQDLYGFSTADQRDFFELLLSISGVGPKSALSIVSSNDPNILRSAIAKGEPDIFMHAAGVGKKTAERIVLELKSKVGIQPDIASGYGQVFEALRSLGYNPPEVKKAIAAIPASITDVQEQLKIALQVLAR
jgi:Holliday junction DNA helicase RuvA